MKGIEMMRHLTFRGAVAIGLLVLLGNLFTPAPANAGLWDTITDAVSDVVDAVESVVEDVVETVQEVAEEVVETVKEVIDSIKVALVGGVTHGRIEQCPLLSEITDYDECWTCTVFMMFFDASNSLAGHVASVLEGPAVTFMWAMFLVWLAFNTAVFFSSVADAPDLGEFATKVGGMIFKILFATVFLQGGASMAFDYFISPVITDASQLANQLVTESTECGGDTIISGGSSKTAMSNETRESMRCMIGGLGGGLREAQKMAQSLRCGAGYWYTMPIILSFLGWEYTPNPMMWALGCMLGGFFWVIALIFPMVLMDAVFRIGLMVGMVPMWVVAWVFPASRGYSKTAFFIVLHSCLLFVVMALVMNMCMKMIMISLTNMGPEFISKMQEGAYVDAYESIESGAEFYKIFILMAICFFGILMPPKAEKITSQISGAKFPPSVGMEALEMMVNLALDIIILILVIITIGCGVILYAARLAQFVHKSNKAIRTMRGIMKAAEQTRKRAKRLQRAAKNAKFSVSMLG